MGSGCKRRGRGPLFGLAAGLIALALVGGAGPAGARAQRIVSVNLCTDQLVLMLAERSRIASLSYLAPRPEISLMAGAAAGIAVNHAAAEEIVALKPDLVLTGPFTLRLTRALLTRLGIRVREVPVPESLSEVRAVVRQVTAALGVRARGEALLRAMDRKLARLAARRPSGKRVAVFLANGVSPGRGTLMDELLRVAGLVNLAAEAGIRGYGYLSLERLLRARPDVIVVAAAADAPPSLAVALLRHPALRRAGLGARIVRLSRRLWACATPRSVDIAERLAGPAP